ncbi:hypothetical protein ACOMHN_005736 [Nucella lapillus]
MSESHQCLRLKGESTDDIVKQICKHIDVDMTNEMIDRSHRVGKPPTAGEAKSRPILVKLSKVLGARKKLSGIDRKKKFPKAEWPTLSRGFQPSGSCSQGLVPRVYFNHDLTRERAQIAWMTRNYKKQKRMDDTWVFDGVIFVRLGEKTYRVTAKREMKVFGLD